MDMYTKLNGRGNILVAVHFDLLWLRKLAKAMVKALEMQNRIFAHFIYENNGN